MAKLVSLAECPPGLFRFNGFLGLKTEYGAMETVGPTNIPGSEVRWTVGNRPDAYCADSGEHFWGGAKTQEERSALMVEPIELVDGLPLAEFPRLRLDPEIDRSKPVPIAIKVAKEGEDPNVWYAPNAERFAVHEDWAEALEANHARHRDNLTPEGMKRRSELAAAKTLIDAETVPADEWTGWVCDGEETYADSVEELIERLADMDVDAPSYCYATYEKGFDFDLEDAIENYLMDEHHEDAEASNMTALMDFYREWTKTARVTTYFPAKQLVIIDPERFAAEVEAARTLIAEAGQ